VTAHSPTNPHYHTVHDTVETLNMELCANISRATAASLALFADE
jgi:hypothetical protein